jgi:hypothetical protein
MSASVLALRSASWGRDATAIARQACRDEVSAHLGSMACGRRKMSYAQRSGLPVDVALQDFLNKDHGDQRMRSDKLRHFHCLRFNDIMFFRDALHLRKQ